MSGLLSFENLKTQVTNGDVDTVLMCFVDMQGRLMGKRFQAHYFIQSAYKESHCCNYLLATDLDMATPEGYASASWEQGYGDYVMKPDLSSIRPMPWLEGTVLVMCDVIDHDTHQEVAHSPRAILKRQVKRLADLGYIAQCATELEFFLFEKTVDDIRRSNYQDFNPISAYNEDYHIFQTTKEEMIMRPLRNHLTQAGIPIECSKGEAETGQEELNILYSEPLSCSEYHTIAKHATKEIAWQHGKTATFMAKWHHQKVGSSSHIHQSLWHLGGPNDGQSAFFDKDGDYGMSSLMRHYLAGLLKYAGEVTYFLAPYVNSYKRFIAGTFAPTHMTWSVDNRTSSFRLCGAGSKSVRVECRIGGSDLNPYLAIATQLAAGIQGIEDKLVLCDAVQGSSYAKDKEASIPHSLSLATQALEQSEMLRNALGDQVVDHYVRTARWEQESYDRIVTDYEVKRGFELA